MTFDTSAYPYHGIIFQLSTNGARTVLFAFDAIYGTNGQSPIGGLLQSPDGSFYGTTEFGSGFADGSVFRFNLTPPAPPELQPLTITSGTAQLTWTSVFGQNYQLQYTTDLNSTNWFDAGNATLATSSTVSATNAIGFDPQRFYRVIRMP